MKCQLRLTSGLEERYWEWYMADDPFEQLARQAGPAAARISMTTQRGADDYGQTKCSCTVTISCPQQGPAMDAAAALAFDTSLRYTNWGMRYLAPHLPPIPGPYSASTGNS